MNYRPQSGKAKAPQLFQDLNVAVKDYIAGHIQKIGENIQVRRFVRYRIGED